MSTGALGLLCPGQKCADTPSAKPKVTRAQPGARAAVPSLPRAAPALCPRGLSGAFPGRSGGGACAGGAGRANGARAGRGGPGRGMWRGRGAPAFLCFASLLFPGRFPACPCPRGRASAGRALLPPRAATSQGLGHVVSCGRAVTRAGPEGAGREGRAGARSPGGCGGAGALARERAAAAGQPFLELKLRARLWHELRGGVAVSCGGGSGGSAPLRSGSARRWFWWWGGGGGDSWASLRGRGD